MRIGKAKVTDVTTNSNQAMVILVKDFARAKELRGRFFYARRPATIQSSGLYTFRSMSNLER